MQIRLHQPVYRFPFVYEGIGHFLGICDVEIITEGVEKPTVVLRDLIENEGPSVDVKIELICSKIANDILPGINVESQEVRWMLCYDSDEDGQWMEISFHGNEEAFTNPRMTEALKVEFDWDSMLHREPLVERTRRKIVTPGVISPEAHHFTADECHRVKTGICSLDKNATPDESPGESGYNFCRDLALLAEVWDVIRDYFGGEVLKTVDKQDIDFELVSYVKSKLLPKYGISQELERDILESIRIFGATTNRDPIIGAEEDGILYLSDGRHRTCVACKLEIPVYALISSMESNPYFKKS